MAKAAFPCRQPCVQARRFATGCQCGCIFVSLEIKLGHTPGICILCHVLGRCPLPVQPSHLSKKCQELLRRDRVHFDIACVLPLRFAHSPQQQNLCPNVRAWPSLKIASMLFDTSKHSIYHGRTRCMKQQLMSTTDLCVFTRTIRFQTQLSECDFFHGSEGGNSSSAVSKIIDEDQGDHQNIAPSRLQICEKDGQPWKLGSGGFGTVGT